MTEGKRGFDLGSLLMVVVLLCMLVAGLWMTGKALDSRFDELNLRLSSASDLIQGDIADLRTEIRQARATKGTVAPAPAKKEAAE